MILPQMNIRPPAFVQWKNPASPFRVGVAKFLRFR